MSDRSTSTSHAEPLRPRPWLAAWALCWREIIRFLRQPNRIVGAVGQPLLFWLLFGVGLKGSFRLGEGDSGPSFQEYFFPGSLMLIILFTAIFATISIIEDRKEGFLQAVLTAPIPRWSMVLGKVLGGSLLALFQALIFLGLGLTLGMKADLAGIAGVTALMFVSGVALTSLGFVIAWKMESTQGFHAIMSLVLLPLWLLSGAFFPLPNGDTWMQTGLHWAMRINPMTYCVAGARRLLTESDQLSSLELPSLTMSWSVALAFAVLTFATACYVSGGRNQSDLL